MANTVSFGMYWQAYGRQEVELPDDINPNDEDEVKAYILSIWDDIPLPGEGEYVDGSDELDEESLDIFIDEEKLIDKETCRRLSAASAKSAVKKLCNGGCICDFDCGKQHPAIQTGIKPGMEECPLAKYGVKPEEDQKLWWECHASEMELTEDELFALCSCCDNTDVVETRDEIKAIRKDTRACMRCPVKMAEEAIQDARTEGACS